MGDLADKQSGASLGSSLQSLDDGRFGTLPNCGILVSLDDGRSATLRNCGILVSLEDAALRPCQLYNTESPLPLRLRVSALIFLKCHT
jgi:hypothetical protein